MLKLEEVNYDLFKSVVINSYHIFGDATFNKLNEKKADHVIYILFKDSKYRLGIIGGIVDNAFISPFSAPFGGFTYLSADVRIQVIEEAIDNLILWTKEKKLDYIKIVLPPLIYNESFISKLINVFFRKKFIADNIELNYHFRTSYLTNKYAVLIWRNARKNLNISLSKNLSFKQCITTDQKKTAYNTIKLNREIRGKPLKMSFEQIELTSEVVPSNYFFVKDSNGNYIASAIVFNVAKGIAQVIYWGDNPDFSHLKTMNFLSYKVFEFYRNNKFTIVDLGYSTVDSIPNYGLCEFKESLGCEINPKFTFKKSVL